MLEIDIKLLHVFVQVFKTRSVSQAATDLGLSQPTISFNLAKLREHYQDSLFVRSSRGMEPTPFAQTLHERVVPLLASFDAVSHHRTTFDPARAERAFQIAMTDISQIVLLPKLLNRLRMVAPAVQIMVSHITAQTAQLLEAGEADLAVGFMPQLGAGFYQQKLFAQRYVCMVARHHPRLNAEAAMRPTLEAYLAEAHVGVASAGTGHALLDRTLGEQQLQRRILLEVPNYLGLANIIAHTDLVATVPQRLADLFAGDPAMHLGMGLGVRLFEMPIEMPTYLIKQHWHERNHQDAAHRWLRGVLTDLFLESNG